MNFNFSKKDDISDILTELENYDVYDFLSRVSALNLMPYNQNKCIVFDEIIKAILQEKQESFIGKNIMSSGKFKQIIEKSMNLTIARNIDPIESPFVYRIQFYGNHWILSGINTSVGFNLQHLLNVLFKNSNDLCDEFLDDCRMMATYILDTSTNIVLSLGYDLDTLEHYERNDVDYPNSHMMQKLVNAITIDLEDAHSFFDSNCDFLFARFGLQNALVSASDTESSFYNFPFLKLDNQKAIVLNPTMLSTFLIYYILKKSKEYGNFNTVIDLYNNDCFRECKHALSKLGHKKIKEDELEIELYNTQNYKEVLLNVGNDGVLWLRFFCDDGTKYNTDNLFDILEMDVSYLEKRWEYIQSKLKMSPTHRIYQMILLNNFGRSISFGFYEKQCEKNITLSPFELLCVAINENSHENFIPRYIDSKLACAKPMMPHYSDIYDITLYSGNNHSFYFYDDIDMRETRRFAGYGDSIDYINSALKKEDRQLAEFPNDNRLRNIVLSDPARSIYCNSQVPPFELLNKFNNINIWVTAPTPDSVEMANTLYSITDLITYWLGESRNIIERAEFICRNLEIRIALQGEIKDYYMETSKSTQPLNQLVEISRDDKVLFMNWTPQGFASLSAKDNTKEYELMSMVLMELFTFSVSVYEEEYLEKIFEDPLKKKMFSLDFQLDPYLKPIDKNFIKIPSECEEDILNELGYYFIKNKGMSIGVIEGDEKNNICNECVTYLFNKLKDIVKNLKHEQLVNQLYLDLESVMYAMMLKQKRYAFDIACYPEKTEKISNEYNELNKSSLALKFLMEYTSSQPVSGDKNVSILDYEYLLALCSDIITWAHSSDFFKYKIINSPMNILKSGRIGIDKTQIDMLSNLNHKAAIARLNDHSSPYIDKYSPKNILSNTPEELNEAFVDEFGYSFSDFYCTVIELVNLGDETENEVNRFQTKDIYDQISQSLKIDKRVVEKIIADLSLRPRKDYLTPPPNFNKNDIWPWRFNRRLSFTRRPIVVRDQILVWGNRQLYHCLQYTIELIRNGKLPVKNNGKLKSLMGRLSNYSGNDFNGVVAEKLKDLGDFIVDSKVKKINNKKIVNFENQDIGDIDVLIICPKTKKIIVAEVKFFSFSKSPYEMHQEYLRVFCDSPDSLCYISKHKRRVEWIKGHVQDVVAQYGLTSGRWKVEDVLIVNEEIISNEFYHENQKMLLYKDINKRNILKI